MFQEANKKLQRVFPFVKLEKKLEGVSIHLSKSHYIFDSFIFTKLFPILKIMGNISQFRIYLYVLNKTGEYH